MTVRAGETSAQSRTASRATKSTSASGPGSAPASRKKATGDAGTPKAKTKSAEAKAGSGPASKRQGLDSKEFGDARAVLNERFDALTGEYNRALADLRNLQDEHNSDASGEDQADVGNKTFEREQGQSLAHGILERIKQVEQALARLDDGSYGQCERCGNPIPKARLEAFPAATLCVTCKQRQERR